MNKLIVIPIEKIKAVVTFPIKNIGNKKFSYLEASEGVSFDAGARYLNPNEEGLLSYTMELSKFNTQNVQLSVYDKYSSRLRGKYVDLPLSLLPSIVQYYNSNCYRSLAIDYKNPLIQQQVKSIIKQPATPEYAYENTNDIFIWVHKNIGTFSNETFAGTEKGSNGRLASVVLHDAYGVCSDRSTILVGLARAAGVPADRIKVVYGRVCFLWQSETDCKENPDGYHAWVSFYYNDKWNDIEMRSLEIDWLNKIGLPLGLEAGHIYHDYIVTILGLSRYSPSYYFNDESCGGSW